jgi:hypothetical protein
MKHAGEGSDRTQPVWFTTADQIALVIGCSMALAMPWHNSPTAQISFAGGLMSRSFAYLVVLDELIRKSCLALVPVLLVRRARFAERGRALESLVVFCAMTQVVITVESLPWIADSFHHTPDPAQPGLMTWVPGPPYWWWKIGALTAGVTAVAMLFLRRATRPTWAESCLIIVAALGFRTAVPDLVTSGTDHLGIVMHMSQDALFFVHEGLNRFPLYLLFGVPAFGALAAARHGRQPVRNWADAIGVGLAALLLFTDQAVQFWADTAGGPSWVVPLLAIHAVQLLCGAVLSWLIVSRVGYT